MKEINIYNKRISFEKWKEIYNNYTKNSFEDRILIDIIETLMEKGEKITIDSCLKESHGLHIDNLKYKLKDLGFLDN